MDNKKNPIEKPFITLDEACRYLGLSKATLYSYTHKRIIPFYKLRGRKIYFRVEDLDDFILNEQNRHYSQSEIETQALTQMMSRENFRSC